MIYFDFCPANVAIFTQSLNLLLLKSVDIFSEYRKFRYFCGDYLTYMTNHKQQ